MTIKDDPKSVIKALDAKALMLLPADLSDAHRALHDARGLVASAVARFRLEDESTRVTFNSALANDPQDQEIVFTWISQIVGRMPPAAPLDGVMMFAVRRDGVIDTATWGQSEADCGAIAAWRDEVMATVPACPFQTWFGWGNEGRPKPLAPAEYAKLTPNQQAYVDRHTRVGA